MAARTSQLFDSPGLQLLLAILFILVCIYGFATAAPDPLFWDMVNQSLPVVLVFALLYTAYRLLIRSPALVLSPLPWFLTVSVLYYGFGPLIYNFGSARAIGILNDYYPINDRQLLETNLLNVIGIGLVVGAFFVAMRLYAYLRPTIYVLSDQGIGANLAKTKISVAVLLTVGLISKYLYSLPSEFGLLDWTLPGIFTQFRDFVSVSIVLLIILAVHSGRMWLILSVVLFLSEVITGILLFSKISVLMPIIMVFIGLYVCYRSRLLMVVGFIVLVLGYIAMVPMVNYGRLEISARSGAYYQADLAERLDVVQGYFGDDVEVEAGGADQGWWRRLTYAHVQGFMMREYDRGSPGDSMGLALYVPVPRLIWPEKPLISEVGNEFNELVTGLAGSAAAAGVFAEAYWCGGWPLMMLGSVYIGLVFAGFTIYALRCLAEYDFIYIPVLFVGVRAGFRPDGWFAIEYVGLPLTAIFIHFAIYAGLSIVPIRTLFARSGKQVTPVPSGLMDAGRETRS